MPVSTFLASIADKAQSAINASPLAGHLPSGHPSSPDSAQQPSANEAAAQGQKSHTLGAIQNQLRAIGQQYTTTTPVQKIITIEKGVAIDFDSLSRDAKSQSKELYTWGQNEVEDLKDVTDRLAYLNFVQGSLASSLSLKLDTARAPLKALRDAETSIAPRRNIRASLNTQLARIEHDQQRGMDKKIAELKDQIRKAELDDQPQEKEIELLKRKAIRESEQLKWEAFREYGEKLVLLAQASAPIIAALPTLPPSPAHPYSGAQATGAARASLQRALDNYKTGHINLPSQLTGSDLHRSDTRSFGESHASELSSINSDISNFSATTGVPTTPPIDHKPAPQPPAPFKPADKHVTGGDKSTSPPINVTNLNQSPAIIPPVSPHHTPSTISTISPELSSSPNLTSAIMPTIAETGVPVSAGADGPGPATGSLLNIRGVPQQVSGGRAEGDAPHYESAAEEKKRLQAAYSQDTTTAPVQQQQVSESSPSQSDGTGGQNPPKKDGNDDLPPNYQDI